MVSEVVLDREFPWMAEMLRQGLILALPGLNHLPTDALQDRLSWEAARLKSLLLVPTVIAGTPRCVLALACTRSANPWPTRCVPRMQLVASLFADTLERMRADREIRRNVDRLAEAQRIAHLGNWEWDLLTREVCWSEEVYRIFGLDSLEFTPSMEAFWTLVHPEDLAKVQHEAQRATEGPEAIYSIDHRIVRPDGSYRVVRELAVPNFDRDGRAVRLAGSTQDITEIHAAYEEIRRLKDQLETENLYLREELSSVTGYGDIIRTSDAIQQVMFQAQQVAVTDSTVLVLGETGTGKELLAHFIHELSPRKSRPFITTNLAAMPSTLVESELFGREKGAFTGALTRHVGRFEVADGGTIFLDEIGEMPLETQAKLLRVLQGGAFERLGSAKTMLANVRVFAATNRDLAAAVRDGTFRQDLYYRLNVFPITVPPLRDRQDDIPQLVWAFAKEFGEKMGKPIEQIKRTQMAALQAYSWPGNIRELRNVIERSLILTKGGELNVTLPVTTGNLCGPDPHGNAEVGDAHLTSPVYHDVGRLQVSMQYSALVNRRQPQAKLPSEFAGLVRRQPAHPTQKAGQVLTVDVLHREERLSIRLADVVNPAYMPVCNGGDSSFAPLCAQIELFERAAAFIGWPRERLVALGEAEDASVVAEAQKARFAGMFRDRFALARSGRWPGCANPALRSREPCPSPGRLGGI
jgi:formate hydrogenlyase transcriptional activator